MAKADPSLRAQEPFAAILEKDKSVLATYSKREAVEFMMKTHVVRPTPQ